MNPILLRKLFEIGGVGASAFGGWLGYEIGQEALANCTTFVNLNGSCPNPDVFAAWGAAPGSIAAAIAFLTRLFK